MTERNSVMRRNSRYVAGGTTEVGQNTLEWWERTNLPVDNATDRLYQVERKFEGRIDLIAALFLGEPRHWWVLAQYNSILDPHTEVLEGSLLRIPCAERVAAILSGGRTGGVDSTREVPPSILPIV